MKVSIVIAVEAVNHFVRENIRHCLDLNFQDFEILLFLSQTTDESFPKTRIVVRPDLALNPAQRRDLALIEASGEILAFIDDDAYPAVDWLDNALPYFDDPTIAAVGGPGVTPPEDNWRCQVSGWSSASFFGGGPSVFYRFMPSEKREIQDYASMNLIVRKSDFAMVGGFDSSFWPGEDTKLCSDLTLKIGKRIIYEPRVKVFHHRREIFVNHLKQNGRYGFHRGYFAKVLPDTSRKLVYFIPSIFAVFSLSTPVTAAIFWFFHYRLSILDSETIASLYLFTLSIYLAILLVNSFWVWRHCRSYRVAFMTIPTIFLTHLWYGFQFIRGFLSQKVKR